MKSFSCFKPKETPRNRSKELDKNVAAWAQNFDSSFKLLLLGPAGAGKTTIMKQMKIIHFEGFTPEERQQKAKEIRANLLESVRVSRPPVDTGNERARP
jgi:GTPase SAR1 family protein